MQKDLETHSHLSKNLINDSWSSLIESYNSYEIIKKQVKGMYRKGLHKNKGNGTFLQEEGQIKI